MAINSPRDALNHILAACVADLALSGISPERRIAASAIVDAARAGLDAPDPVALVPMPVWEGGNIRLGLGMLIDAARVEGRHYLPSAWVLGIARRILDHLKEGGHDPLLVNYALAYVDLAASGDAGQLMDREELAEAQSLLEGLRPPKPLAPAIEALLVQARAEQVIDAGEEKDLRDLARRLAK